jgi:hypothetical protein
MSKTINGPYNIVRLEGEINNTKKIIYIFSDIHTADYECDDIDSPDITKYLLKVFRKAKNKLPDKYYDFFVETHTRPESETFDIMKRREYIYMVRKMFYHLNRKKLLLSKEMNIRLHYTDFRDYLNTSANIDMMNHAFTEINNMFVREWIDSHNIDNIINIVSPVPDIIKNLQHFINGDLKKILIDDKTVYLKHGDITVEQSNNMLNNIFMKIRYDYKNKDVQSILTDIFANINKMLGNTLSKYAHFIEFLNKARYTYTYTTPYPQLIADRKKIIKTISKIKIYLLDIDETLSYIDVILIDIFMLRRFLDKEYITNALYYCGGHHANIITTILVKYFDFKITHIAKSEDTVDNLNKKLKNIDLYKSNMKEILKPDYQCSSIEGFPDLLT